MIFPSGAAAKKFPTYEHIVEAGLMTETELEQITLLEKVNYDTNIGDNCGDVGDSWPTPDHLGSNPVGAARPETCLE